jgi:hypothetical protein
VVIADAGPRNGIAPLNAGSCAAAWPMPDNVRNVPCRSPITQKASPPRPVKCGYVTHSAAPIAIAASMALPPARKTSRPASLANA